MSWKTKEPRNMFMLTFSNDEESKKINKTKHRTLYRETTVDINKTSTSVQMIPGVRPWVYPGGQLEISQKMYVLALSTNQSVNGALCANF